MYVLHNEVHQIARVEGWPRLYKYDVIGDWQCSYVTGLQGASLDSGSYKMMDGSRVCKLEWDADAMGVR